MDARFKSCFSGRSTFRFSIVQLNAGLKTCAFCQGFLSVVTINANRSSSSGCSRAGECARRHESASVASALPMAARALLWSTSRLFQLFGLMGLSAESLRLLMDPECAGDYCRPIPVRLAIAICRRSGIEPAGHLFSSIFTTKYVTDSPSATSIWWGIPAGM